MSITTIKSIHCDGCGEWRYGNVGERMSILRRRLRRQEGWITGIPDAGITKDYCPKCK